MKKAMWEGLRAIGGPEAKKALEDLIEIEETGFTKVNAQAALDKMNE